MSTTTATFNYQDVVAHLEGMGHEYLETAARLRRLMTADVPISAPAAAAPVQQQAAPDAPAAALKVKAVRRRKSTLGLGPAVVADESEESEPEPASFTPTPPATEGVGTFGENGRFHRLTQVPKAKVLDTPGPAVALPTIADLVRRAAREATPRTTIGLINRVEEIAAYRVKRETVSSTISQYLASGQLIRKGEDAAGAPYIRPADEAATTNGVHA